MFLRLIARPLMAKVKGTTGSVGFDVVPNAREELIGLYTKTLKVNQVTPQDSVNRKAMEIFTKLRLKLCREEQDCEMIGKKLCCDQVEELIEEVRSDLTLTERMIGRKPWAVAEDYFCEIVDDDAPVPEHVPLHWPGWNPRGVDEDYICEIVDDDAPVPGHVPFHQPGPLPDEFYKMLGGLWSHPEKDAPAVTASQSL